MYTLQQCLNTLDVNCAARAMKANTMSEMRRTVGSSIGVMGAQKRVIHQQSHVVMGSADDAEDVEAAGFAVACVVDGKDCLTQSLPPLQSQLSTSPRPPRAPSSATTHILS